MKNLNSLFFDVMADVNNAHIVPGTIIKVSWNTRAKKRWGCCKKKPNGFEIEISAMLVDDSIPESIVKDVICHEILHTCSGAFNHGRIWKSLAYRMMDKGYRINRAQAPGKDGYPDEEESKYKFICKGCGVTVKRIRASNFTRFPERYKCARCGGSFVAV